MTFAQFRRMKPKYQIRIVIAALLALLLFVGVLFGISGLFTFVEKQMNTKTLQGVTSVNILHQNTFTQILRTMGQGDQDQDPEQVYVLDSRIACNDKGGVEQLEIHMVSLVSKKQSDYWTLSLKNDVTKMRLTESENRNRSSYEFSKLTLAKYFPTLQLINSPTWLAKLQETYPVGGGGKYIFDDHFENALDPSFALELDKGYDGFKVSSTGNNVSPLPKTTAVTPGSTVPYLLSVEAVDTKKTKPNRVVLQDAKPVAVILFGVTEYRIG